MPGAALSTVLSPQTARGRAELYIAAANRDWFHSRGLHASLLNTLEIGLLSGVTVEQLLNAAQTQQGSANKLRALENWIDDLEIYSSGDVAELNTPRRRRSPPANPYYLGGKKNWRYRDPDYTIETVTQIGAADREYCFERALRKRQALATSELRLGPSTLWLVFVPVDDKEKIEAVKKSRTGMKA